MNSSASQDVFRFNAQSTTAVSWYWTPEWQAWEKEADDDWQAGRYEVFDSMDDFIDSLDVD